MLTKVRLTSKSSTFAKSPSLYFAFLELGYLDFIVCSMRFVAMLVNKVLGAKWDYRL
jgi:hypothetical protein